MMNDIIQYNDAVQAIKTAILQGQYEAAKGVNRIQLAVYFAIAKYISVNTRSQAWGSHALEFISNQLQKELPGLRGYSANSMKNMRKFYEQWVMLDADNSTVATAEIEKADNSTIAIVGSEANESCYWHCALPGGRSCLRSVCRVGLHQTDGRSHLQDLR